MATVDMTKGGSGRTARAALYGKENARPYAVIDLADVATEKGSAIATGDVIQAITVPGNSYLNTCFVKVVELADCTTFNFDVGFAGDADMFVDGQGMTSGTGSAGELVTHAAGAIVGTLSRLVSANDTIDITIMTFTGTAPTTGQLAVFADITDLTAEAGSNIADVQ
jgi:hypothetical protein